MAIGSRWVPRAPSDRVEARSAWAFARAVGLEPVDAEIAVRAACATAPPSSGLAALLVAAGEVTASLRDLAVEGPSRFARAFRSLSWPVQVVLWGGAVDAIPLSIMFSELGPHAAEVWDPSRQLLHAYILEGARSARPECAAALTRVAAHIEAASLRDPRDLDPHIAGCRSCQYGFPIRVAEELQLLAAPAGLPPAHLGRQLAADRDRLAAGLPLLVGAPRAPVPRARVLAVAGGVAVIAAIAVLIAQRGGPQAPRRPVASAAAAPATASVAARQGPSKAATAGSSAVFETSHPTSTTAATPSGAGLSVAFGPQGSAATVTGSHSVAAAGHAISSAPSPVAAPPAAGAPAPAPSRTVLPFPGGEPMAVTPTTGAPFVPAPVPYIPPPIPTTTSPPPTTTPPSSTVPSTSPPPTTTPPPSTVPSTTTALSTTTTGASSTTTNPPTTTTTTTTVAAMTPFVGGPLAVFVPGIGLPLVAWCRQRRRASPRSRSR